MLGRIRRYFKRWDLEPTQAERVARELWTTVRDRVESPHGWTFEVAAIRALECSGEKLKPSEVVEFQVEVRHLLNARKYGGRWYTAYRKAREERI